MKPFDVDSVKTIKLRLLSRLAERMTQEQNCFICRIEKRNLKNEKKREMEMPCRRIRWSQISTEKRRELEKNV
jgi:hypothetical protein